MAWTSILGQSTAVRLLQSDLIRNRLAPAYLLIGCDGVGKRSAAVEFVKAVHCDHPLDGPCDQCVSCRGVMRGVHPDVHILIPQGTSATISIDEVRWLLERVALRPFLGRRSMVILDGAHRLTDEAANSLLKVLEEPPGQTTFLLITAQAAQCLPTIRSRCRIVRFQRLDPGMIEEALVAVHRQDGSLARVVSRIAQGSLSQALALCSQWPRDQAIHEHLAAGEARSWMTWSMPKERDVLARWLDASIEWLRDVAVASAAAPSLVRHAEHLGAVVRQAQALPRDRCIGTAFRLIELKRSFEEQRLSSRLVGTLLREEWLELLECGMRLPAEASAQAGNSARPGRRASRRAEECGVKEQS